MKRILKCTKCKGYTLKEKCPKCSEKTITVAPPKYSPEDKYGQYRRQIKLPQYKEQGLL